MIDARGRSRPAIVRWAAAALGLVLVATALQATSAPAHAAPAETGAGGFVPVAPTRLLDTRTLLGQQPHVSAQQTINVPVTGNGGVPADGVAAVSLNVTVTDPDGEGFITVFPHGAERPTASSLNFVAGQTVPNHVIVGVGADGSVDLFDGSAGRVSLIADIDGYFLGGSELIDGGFAPLAPTRVLDTRSGLGAPRGAVAAGSALTLSIGGQAGVPADASAVVVNVTATEPTSPGYVSVYPHRDQRPLVSNLNLQSGETRPNLVVVRLGEDGQIDLFSGLNSGTVHLIADIMGYFTAGDPMARGAFVPITPVRKRDTRESVSGPIGAVPPAGTLDVDWRNETIAVPGSGISALVLNVTAVDATGAGFITAFQTGDARPAVSNLNFLPGATAPNLVIVPVNELGWSIRLFNGSPGTVHVVVDVAGYISGGGLPAFAGTVTDPTGNPLAGVQVLATSGYPPSAGEWAAAAVTDATGRYLLIGPRWQTVCFNGSNVRGPSAAGYESRCVNYGSGNPASVAGTITDHVDAVLAASMAASGRVRDPDGTPLAGIAVSACYGGQSLAVTATDGTYVVRALSAPTTGTVSVCTAAQRSTSPGSSPGGYQAGTHSLRGNGSADVVPQNDLVLTRGGGISGSVTDPFGNPLAGVSVEIGRQIVGDTIQYAYTDLNGHFGLYGLAAGPSYPCFRGVQWMYDNVPASGGQSRTGYANACYDGTPYYPIYPSDQYAPATMPTIASVPISIEQDRTVNAVLPQASALSGHVRTVDGSPVSDVMVAIYDLRAVPRPIFVSVSTDASGAFFQQSLRPGDYKVCYWPSPAFLIPDPRGLAAQCYSDAPTTMSGSERVISLAAGEERSGVDANLDAGATVTGRVTDVDGNPLSEVAVDMFRVNAIDPQAHVTTNANGEYTVTNLQPAEYSVCFDGPSAVGPKGTGYARICWQNQPSASRTPVAVPRNGAVAGIDAVMTKL